MGLAGPLSAGVLPPLLVLTDRRQARAGLVATVAAAVDGGARAVVLREKDLAGEARVQLAGALGELLDPVGGMLLLAGADVRGARAAGAGGVHLAAADPKPPTGTTLVAGRSCHDADDVRRAADEGVNYVTVSPIFASPSKPGYGPALGLAGLAALVALAATAPVPVYALGGVSAASAGSCLAAGAAGVAVMSAVMAAADPAAATAALLDALGVPAGSR